MSGSFCPLSPSLIKKTFKRFNQTFLKFYTSGSNDEVKVRMTAAEYYVVGYI